MVALRDSTAFWISLPGEFLEPFFNLVLGPDTFECDDEEPEVRLLAFLQCEIQVNRIILLVIILSLEVTLSERIRREQAIMSCMPERRVVDAFRVIEDCNTDDLVISYTL